jgi:hypothetical protein
MDGITCAVCDRPFFPDDRAIFLGVERLLLHGTCYDAAVERLGPDLGRVRRAEDSQMSRRRRHAADSPAAR